MTPRACIFAVLREPLVHFLIVGVALFLLYRAVNDGEAIAPREIVVSAARVDALADSFATTWMRPPTAGELKGLVDDYVAEEVYAREAIALGLDRDDSVIRRRLRQKMEFISDDVAAEAEPTEAQLQTYLAEHGEQFIRPAELAFKQIYFSSDRRGAAARRDAERLRADLQAGRGPANPAEAGDPSLLPQAMQAASPQAIQSTFGSDFAAQLEQAPVGQWSGPIQSDYGLHLVQVERREAGTTPSLADVRPAVRREWQAEQRRQSRQAVLDALRTRYEVRIEGPAAALLEQAGSSATSSDRGAGQ